MRDYPAPSREEFLAMLSHCAEVNTMTETFGDPVLESARRDARIYLRSDRCLVLCQKYLTKVSPGTPTGGGAQA